MSYRELIEKLEKEPVLPYPVIMPDFFLDHFVLLSTLVDFTRKLEDLAVQGGGNLMGTEQFVRPGGNTINTASALLALGLDPKVIITTDEHGLSLLKALVDPRLDLSHVHTDGKMSSTVSIELRHNERPVNLMVSDSGSASEFDFAALSESDLRIIKDCGLIALVNLNHNRCASELAKDLFTFVGSETSALRFMDMGDPSSNPDIVSPLVKNVLSEGLVDILGINENEAGWIVRELTDDKEHWEKLLVRPEQWIEAGEVISEETGVRVDLHTPKFTASIEDGQVTSVPVFELVCRVSCGAGDAWNAGNIYGTLLGLSSKHRLQIANAVSGLYVSSTDSKHPALTELIEFLKGSPPVLDA